MLEKERCPREFREGNQHMLTSAVAEKGTQYVNRHYRGLTYKGIPPTGKQVTWTETWIERIADGKIVEFWSNEDDLGRLQQIGALPTPGQAS
jgi:predicted ester cyclase